MATVKLDIKQLDAAHTALGNLSNIIDSERHRAAMGTPLGLDDLADGSALARAARWLRDQETPIQKLKDLATLLDVDHEGQVSYAGTGTSDETNTLLAAQLTKGLKGIGDIDNKDDRARATELAEIFKRYAKDPSVAGPTIKALGPAGTTSVLYQLQALLYDDAPRYAFVGSGLERTQEVDDIRKLQDSLAASLSIAVGSASTSGQLPDDFGKQMVDNSGDGWAVGTLFHYGDLNHVDFGTKLLVSAGDELLAKEESGGELGWEKWQVNRHTPTSFGMDGSDDKLVDDPTLQWLKVLDNNVDASQEIMLDPSKADYLLGDRSPPYEKPPGDAAGDVLKVATIDQALGFDPASDAKGSPADRRAKNAALISSHVIDHFGEGARALDGVDEEIGGILATYITDVDRTATRSDDGGPGTYAGPHPDLPGFLKGVKIPYYGINIDKGDLTDILGDIGGNDVAVSTLGGAATRYNQLRLNDGADHSLNGPHDGEPSWGVGTDGDPLIKSINESSELQGFLQDGLINGAIDDANDDAEARAKVASMFTLPLDYVPVPGGAAGGFVVDQIKDAISNEYVGDGVDNSISHGNDQYEIARQSTTLQAYYSMLGAHSDNPWGELNAGDQTRVDSDGHLAMGKLRRTWPGAADGYPVPPSELTAAQIKSILDEGDQVPGYGSTAGSTVNGAWGNLKTEYGDN